MKKVLTVFVLSLFLSSYSHAVLCYAVVDVGGGKVSTLYATGDTLQASVEKIEAAAQILIGEVTYLKCK